MCITITFHCVNRRGAVLTGKWGWLSKEYILWAGTIIIIFFYLWFECQSDSVLLFQGFFFYLMMFYCLT